MRERSSDPGPEKRPKPPGLDWNYDDMPTPKTYDGRPAVRCLERNEAGRDLIVGDIHGQRETFERLLEKVGYSPDDGDRLLLLGDLIDRGPDSPGMLGWLGRDGVECVRGNHEQMMLDAFEEGGDCKELWMHRRNGGSWATGLGPAEREDWLRAVRRLPFALEVDTAQGPLVLVHAEIPEKTPWWAFKAWLEEGDRAARLLALWSKDRLQDHWFKRRQLEEFGRDYGQDAGVPDVWRAFHGHISLQEPVRLQNIRWIDTSASQPDSYSGAAVACVEISPSGIESEPLLMEVLDVDPGPERRPKPLGIGWDDDSPVAKTYDGRPAVRCLERNEVGRDLIVSDIHGQRETFERLLGKVGYSPDAGDRLLLLGDLIDRGPDSPGMLEWLDRDGVECVRGDHEQMMLDAFEEGGDCEQLWMENGGSWARELGPAEREDWLRAVRRLPFALEVDTVQGPLVLVHAEISKSTPWWAFKAWLEEGDRAARTLALWSTTRLHEHRFNRVQLEKFGRDLYGQDAGVPDVWRAFHGHFPLQEPACLHNIRWIDTSAGYADRRSGAAVACVEISPSGIESEPRLMKILDVDPGQAPAPRKGR